MALGFGDIPLTATPGMLQGMAEVNSLTDQALSNRIKGIQAQYAPQMTQAELAYKQAQTPYIQAQTDLTGQQAQYYGPNIQSEISYRNALASGVPSEIALRQAQAQNQIEEAKKLAFFRQHPGFYGDETTKMMESWRLMGLPVDRFGMPLNQPLQQQPGMGSQPISQPQIPMPYPASPGSISSPQQQSNYPYTPIQQSPQTPLPISPSPNQLIQPQPTIEPMGQNPLSTVSAPEFDPARPFNTGNPIVDASLNRRYANAAYQAKQVQGYNWSHLPVEAKNQLIAQGYGMNVDPIKMSNYINKGLDLKQIAEAEGLDPDNLPPPRYPPTTATKTRTQQVEQVTAELDYLSSMATPIIKKYADTFMNISPARLSDMFSDDPSAQKRFGEYIGALSLQTGLANARNLAEGGRPGVEVMRMVKDSALKGIDQNSPIRMTGTAFQAAQDKIDEVLQKGAKIRITTGMNPLESKKQAEGKEEKGKESEKKKADLVWNSHTQSLEINK